MNFFFRKNKQKYNVLDSILFISFIVKPSSVFWHFYSNFLLFVALASLCHHMSI
jgi:hypothetical protein